MRKEYDFARLTKAEPKYLRRVKRAVTMRLDPATLAYFQQLATEMGMPYQSLINYVLKQYASGGLAPSANWPSRRKRTG